MKILLSKNRQKIYKSIATIHIWLTYGPIEDPEEKRAAYDALSEIVLLLGGIKGLEYVKRIIRKWEANHEQKRI